MPAQRHPSRSRIPAPPEIRRPGGQDATMEDVISYLRRLVHALEQNDVAADAVFQDHATLIDELTP